MKSKGNRITEGNTEPERGGRKKGGYKGEIQGMGASVRVQTREWEEGGRKDEVIQGESLRE